jgi:hypothetical protein
MLKPKAWWRDSAGVLAVIRAATIGDFIAQGRPGIQARTSTSTFSSPGESRISVVLGRAALQHIDAGVEGESR